MLTLLIGCSGSGAPTALPAATTPTSMTTFLGDLAAVRATLTRYFAALTAGDFQAAMNERCAAARVPDEEEDLFLSQTESLLEMGAMTAVEVSDKPGVQVLPLQASTDPIPFDYAVISERSDWLHGVAITQDGAVKLCGYAQPDFDRMTDELTIAVPSDGDLTQTLVDLIPKNGPDGYQQVEDRAVSKDATSPAGWQESWTRVWQHPTFGGVRVTATRFDATASASTALSASLAKIAGDATATFTIAGIGNAIGVRYSAAAWTWLQPPNVGYQGDRVQMLFGNTLITIEATGLAPDEPHQIVTDLAISIDNLT